MRKGLEQRRIWHKIGAKFDKIQDLVDISWYRPEAAAPTQLLAWEPPNVVSVALKRQKKKKNLQNSSRMCFRLIFTIEMELGVSTTDLSSLLLLLFLPENSLFLLLRSIITENYSSIAARLWSQNDSGLNGFSCVRKLYLRVPTVVQGVSNPACLFGGSGLIPGRVQWVRDPALLQLWCRSQLWLRFNS